MIKLNKKEGIAIFMSLIIALSLSVIVITLIKTRKDFHVQ